MPSLRPDAEIRLPADSAYVSVLRMTTAAIGARLDFTLDADVADQLLAKIDEIAEIFWETKKA
jgi:serine/threonine-protein kinase RsbW